MIRNAVLGYIGHPQGLPMLNAGCGTGHFSRVFVDLRFSVTGIDFSPAAIAEARDAVPGEFLVADLSDLRLRKRYDVVVSIDVLFHIVDEEEWENALSALAQHARDDG